MHVNGQQPPDKLMVETNAKKSAIRKPYYPEALQGAAKDVQRVSSSAINSAHFSQNFRLDYPAIYCFWPGAKHKQLKLYIQLCLLQLIPHPPTPSPDP